MDLEQLTQLYNFTGRTVAITGGSGVLGSEMAVALAELGANVAILDRETKLPPAVQKRLDESSGKAIVVASDVLNREAFEESVEVVLKEFGGIDILINGAGGNHPNATTNPERTFFDLPAEAIRFTSDLNLLGSIIPCQVVGKLMAERGDGVILNISSMSALRPLTRVTAYSAAKAAVSNFTQWLAVHMAQEYSPSIRVNALAPGFFLTNQNRFLLTDEKSGGLTERGKSIIDHTPQGRFGDPEDLLGTVLWLLSPASTFVTGIVVPVDGGFSAFSGV
jgi:NAD(P)-dependent dehydrogenase (short-subunit alcohol dehydrogenase family)